MTHLEIILSKYTVPYNQKSSYLKYEINITHDLTNNLSFKIIKFSASISDHTHSSSNQKTLRLRTTQNDNNLLF